MIEIIKELKVEVSKPNVFQAIVAKQYDMNTRFLKVTFVDGPDVICIPNSETIKVVINAERKDGQSKGFDGVVNDDGTVTVPLHSWMLELDGTVICDISAIDTEANDNKKLTTTSFTLIVEKAAYGGGDITSDPQYDVLVQLLETCSTASAAAEDALQKSTEANAKYEACVEATEQANAVREEIEAGGYIESLKEMNKGGKFTFWVGTKEEFKAIGTRIENCLYIFTDAPDAIESEKHPGCYYREVDGEIEWINPPMIMDEEYRTAKRAWGRPVYVKRISTSIEDVGGNCDVPILSNVDSQSISIVSIEGYAYQIQEGSTDFFHWVKLSNLYVYCADEQETTFYVRITTPTEEVAAGTAYVTVEYTKR